MSLTDAYTSFLRTRDGKDALVAALGNRLEGRLLARWNGGAHAVDTAWLGATPPADAEPFALWLDVVELMPMLLVPRVEAGDRLGWLAARPVERWQYGAFLELADIRFKGRELFDRSRLLAGPETGPVTRVLRDEADLYAHWFGKTLPDRVVWQLVAEALPDEPLQRRWDLRTEWGEEAEEGAYSLVTPDNVELDPLEGDDVPTLDAWQAPDGVSFRTLVHDQLGLLDQPTYRAAELPAELRDMALRGVSRE
jgi:hypothetical protein